MLEEIKAFIAETSKHLKRSPPPHDYISLKKAAIINELDSELSILKPLLSENDPVAFQTRFKERCKTRTTLNTETCLSFTSLQDGECNQLYWKIAKIAYNPHYLREMLAILLPGITTVISTELSLHAQTKKIQIHLVSSPIETLDETSLDCAVLKNYVVSDNLLFNVSEIAHYSFELHQIFYTALVQNHPKLAQKLYQHNADFRNLHAQLSLLSEVETPRNAIQRLVVSLKLSGESVTGKKEATPLAMHACSQFLTYLDAVPVPFKNDLLALDLPQNKNKTLATVLKDLELGNCVETAAQNLLMLVGNDLNKTLLDTHPTVSAVTIQSFKQFYKKNKKQGLSLQGHDACMRIPTYLLEKSLKRIQLKTAENYLTMLLNFTPEQYPLIFQYATLTPKHNQPILPEGLASMIAVGLLNKEQVEAFNLALIHNLNKMGGLSEIVRFSARSNNAVFFDQAQAFFEKDTLLAAIEYTTSNEKNALQLAAQNAEVLQTILTLYPDAATRQIAIEKPDHWQRSLLHLTKGDARCTQLLLEQYPRGEVFETITQPDRNGRTPLMMSVSCLSTFRKFSEPTRLMQGIMVADNYKRNTFHYAASNPDALTDLINLCAETNHPIPFFTADAWGDTPLHIALAKNAVCARILLFHCTDHDLQNILFLTNNEKFNLMLIAAKNANILQSLINLLPTTTMALTAATKKNKNKCTALHLAAPDPRALKMLLDLFPTLAEKHKALKVRSQFGNVIAHATTNLESLLLVLSLYPSNQRLSVLLQECGNNSTVLRSAVKNKIPLEPLFNALSDNTQLADAYNAMLRYVDTLKISSVNRADDFIEQMSRQITPSGTKWQPSLFSANTSTYTTLLCISGFALENHDLEILYKFFIDLHTPKSKRSTLIASFIM